MSSQQSFSIHSIRNLPEPIQPSLLQQQPILLALIQIQSHFSSISKLISAIPPDPDSTDPSLKQLYEIHNLLRETFQTHHQPLAVKLQQILQGYQEVDSSPITHIMNCELDEEMTFMEMINVIVEEGVEFQELFQYLDTLKVESKQDLILLSQQLYQSKQSEKDTTHYYNPSHYFLTDISQMFIEIVSDKINSNNSLTETERDLVYYLTQQKQYRRLSSDQLRKQYHYIRQKLELDSIEIQHFFKLIKVIQAKLMEGLKKNNYIHALENEFKKADVTKIGRVNYSAFSGVLVRLRLTLGEGEISSLFRYCIYCETQSYQELINKAYLIDYRQFMSNILNKGYGKGQSDPVGRIPQYRSLVKSLKEEKVELSKVLTSRNNKIEHLQSRLLQYELQHCNKQNSVHQIMKNQRKMLSGKYEAEISRLNRVNESQKQMIDSYRIELQNIMAEIHVRHSITK